MRTLASRLVRAHLVHLIVPALVLLYGTLSQDALAQAPVLLAFEPGDASWLPQVPPPREVKAAAGPDHLVSKQIALKTDFRTLQGNINVAGFRLVYTHPFEAPTGQPRNTSLDIEVPYLLKSFPSGGVPGLADISLSYNYFTASTTKGQKGKLEQYSLQASFPTATDTRLGGTSTTLVPTYAATWKSATATDMTPDRKLVLQYNFSVSENSPTSKSSYLVIKPILTIKTNTFSKDSTLTVALNWRFDFIVNDNGGSLYVEFKKSSHQAAWPSGMIYHSTTTTGATSMKDASCLS